MSSKNRIGQSAKETVLKRPKLMQAVAALFAVLLSIYAVNSKDYLIFHSGVELFICVVTASVFVVGWNGRRYIDSGFYLILMVSCLSISILHALHLLAYKGLAVVGDGPDTATQLWVATRYLTAVFFLLAPLFVKRRLNAGLLVALLGGVTSLLLLSIFTWNIFPRCFVEPGGLTPFKKISEYVICGLFLLSMWLLWRKRKDLPKNVFQPLLLGVGAGIGAEISFSLYTDVYGIFNALGHLLILLSFGMIYKGLVEATLRSPYETLFRDLKRSEERYRNLVELSPDTVLIHRDNSIVFVNTAALRLFGAAEDSDLLGRTPFDIFQPDSHALVREWIDLLQKGGRVPLGEAKILRLDGEVRDVEVSASSLSGQEGAAIQVILRDVSTRKRDEEALRESEQRFRSVVEANMIGVLFANPGTGQVTDANDEYLRIIGRSRRELDAGLLNYREITPPDILEREDRLPMSVGGKPVQPFEKEYIRPDGSRVPVIIGGAFLDQPRNRVVAFVLDYTEHKQAERERDITIAFLRLVNDTTALHDLVRVSVAFFSDQSGCEAVGIRLKEGDDYPYYGTTGLSAEFVRGESSLCIPCGGGGLHYDGDGLPLLDCLCGAVIRGQCDPAVPFYTAAGSFWTNSTTELKSCPVGSRLPAHVRHRCNAEGYESVVLIPLRCGDEPMGLLQMNDRRKNLFTPRVVALWERLAGYLAVALAKARAEEALRESAVNLARSNKDLEQFAYIASHDLQEPLRQISGFVRLLHRNYEPQFDQNAKEFFDFIQDGAHRMQSLINDLLQYSRVSRNKTALSSVDLNEVCRTARNNLQARISETRASITVKPLPAVKGNPTLLAQVFQNLLANSLKFRGQAQPEIEVGARQDGNEWLVWVKDNGIGFDEEYADNIFMVFQRLHPRHAYDGTGIGLAICKRAVEQHGGRIWAESKPNQGATFYFTLPAATP
ncbi:MAG TPA: MASE3 domain-containing protein [Candidatus Bathyarchaeia archaeon]|nr:MASE3 domain-containing protein [Candidatus Bathyarchaeia archaeon]